MLHCFLSTAFLHHLQGAMHFLKHLFPSPGVLSQRFLQWKTLSSLCSSFASARQSSRHCFLSSPFSSFPQHFLQGNFFFSSSSLPDFLPGAWRRLSVTTDTSALSPMSASHASSDRAKVAKAITATQRDRDGE